MYSRKHQEIEAQETRKRLIKEGKMTESAAITIPVKLPPEPLYFSHWKEDDIPDDDVVVMRYMDFRKFQYLIREASLYMSAPKCFAQDASEGYLIDSVRNYLDVFCEEMYIKLQKYFASKTYLRPATISFSGNKEIDLERMRKSWFKIYKHNIRRYFISCWSERNVEQDNMWRAYIPDPEDRKTAVVIKTTVGKLKTALKHNSGMFTIARIKYVDLDTFCPNDIPRIIQGVYPLSSYMLKIKDACFEDDHEIRVMTDSLMSNTTQWYRGAVMGLLGEYGFDYGAEPDKYFLEAPLDLNGFIDEIIVSPTAQPEFIDEVKIFLTAHGLNDISVKTSNINKRREMEL